MSIDIYSIPLYYISFNKNTELEKNLVKTGFNNINHFAAVDGRKLKPDQLIEDGKISIRAYNDLIFGRHEHSGLPSVGSVGCTLSHYSLWKKCIDDNLPYITIAEDDLYIDRKLSTNDEQNIKNAIQTKNGLFVSSIIDRNAENMFMGLHLYFLSNECCKQLVKYTFPIDIQTDFYVSNLARRKKINIEGYIIGKQKIHYSSIQDMCVKCYLPKKSGIYILIGTLILFFSIFSMIRIVNCLKH